MVKPTAVPYSVTSMPSMHGPGIISVNSTNGGLSDWMNAQKNYQQTTGTGYNSQYTGFLGNYIPATYTAANTVLNNKI